MDTQTTWNWPLIGLLALNCTAWGALITAAIVGYELVS